MGRDKQPEGKRQGTRGGTGFRKSASSLEALAATHENSVPVLPAFGPPQQAGGSSARTPNTSYQRGTRAPGGTTRQRTQGQTTGTFTRDARTTHAREQFDAVERTNTRTGSTGGTGYGDYGEHAGYGHGGYGYNSDLPEGVADEIPDADTYEQDVYARGSRMSGTSGNASRALVPRRPTLGLPTLPEDRLPAVAGDGAERQLALAADGAADVPAILIRGTSKPLKPYTPIVPRRHGPRSFMSQFIVSMVAVMTIFTVLTLASPLGHSQAFAGTFQTYANAVPWVPTPTPTPKPAQAYVPPSGANPGQQAVINDIVAVFGQYANGAINVARCESGFDPNAWNPYAIAGSHASGVFQILYPSTWSTTSWSGSSPYNYDANIHAAYQIFSRDGYSWREWSCGIYA